MRAIEVVTKSVRLEPEENENLQHVSKTTGLSEAALMKRSILEGLARHRLQEAIVAYSHGEMDLSAAARHAEISVYQMMTECERRQITPSSAQDKLLDRLQSLADAFGSSNALSLPSRSCARATDQMLIESLARGPKRTNHV